MIVRAALVSRAQRICTCDPLLSGHRPRMLSGHRPRISSKVKDIVPRMSSKVVSNQTCVGTLRIDTCMRLVAKSPSSRASPTLLGSPTSVSSLPVRSYQMGTTLPWTAPYTHRGTKHAILPWAWIGSMGADTYRPCSPTRALPKGSPPRWRRMRRVSVTKVPVLPLACVDTARQAGSRPLRHKQIIPILTSPLPAPPTGCLRLRVRPSRCCRYDRRTWIAAIRDGRANPSLLRSGPPHIGSSPCQVVLSRGRWLERAASPGTTRAWMIPARRMIADARCGGRCRRPGRSRVVDGTGPRRAQASRLRPQAKRALRASHGPINLLVMSPAVFRLLRGIMAASATPLCHSSRQIHFRLLT